MTVLEWSYMVAVLSLGGFLTWRTLLYLGSVRRGRLKVLGRRTRFEVTPTETPLQNPRGIAEERAVRSIERQFTVMRRALVPLILVLTGLLAFAPLLARTSASTTTLLAAVLAAVVGLAARPLIENALAGLVISGSGLVRIGDTVKIAEHYGTVEDITPTHTVVKVWDWRRYLVPNATMLSQPMINLSLYDRFEHAHVDFWVAPEADLAEVGRIAREAALASGLVYGEEAPAFWLTALERDGIRCTLAAWVKSPTDAWSLRSFVRERIATELRRHHIPTMRQTLHVGASPASGAGTSANVRDGPSPVSETFMDAMPAAGSRARPG